MNDKDRVWLLAGKKLAGEASADELSELEGLLRSDPDMHYPLQNINDIWHLPNREEREADEVFSRHLSRMKAAGITDWKDEKEQELSFIPVDDPFRQNPPRSYHTLIWVSVVACLVLVIGFFLYYPSNSTKITEERATDQAATKNEISTRNGSKTKISLPDGSTVWLNSGSNLVYPKEFGNTTREVELTGEAFFDVVKNPAHPFIIHTRHIDIRVIGTAFNVRSYPGDQRTITSLVRGKVEVFIHNRPNEKFVLRPNEKLMVLNDEAVEETGKKEAAASNQPMVSVSKLTYSKTDSLVVETAWVENKLVFDNESFVEVAAKMKRWYNMEVEFADAASKALRFTGVFENETIQQALDAMMITAEFHYRFHGNKVVIQK